jgi:hypothetical protein
VSVSIEIDADDLIAGLRELDVELDREMAHALAASTDIVEREAATLAPKVSGDLARSVRAEPPSGTWQARTLEGSVVVDAPYVLPVHDGARPHVIRPWRAGALAFTMGGRLVITQTVNHPGNRPNPFLEFALELRAPEIEGEFGSAIDTAFHRSGFGR